MRKTLPAAMFLAVLAATSFGQTDGSLIPSDNPDDFNNPSAALDDNPAGLTGPGPSFSYPTNATLKWILNVDGSDTVGSVALAPDGTLYVPRTQTGLWAINTAAVNPLNPNYPNASAFAKWVITPDIMDGFGNTAIGTDGTIYIKTDYNKFSRAESN